jgi:hypothetical protein
MNEDENEDSYFDFGTLSKGLMILGIIVLLMYALLYISSFITSSQETWEGSFVGDVNAFLCALPLSIILLVAGGILYFFHRAFNDLGAFAQEVESGEFEEKISKELDEEDKQASK